MKTILDFKVNMFKGTYMSVYEHENLHFDHKHNTHMSYKNYERSGYDLHLGFANHLVLN